MKNRITYIFNIIICLIFSTLFCVTLCGCSNDTVDPIENSGKKIAIYDDDNNLLRYESRFYNTDGEITRLDVYDADDNYDHYVIYDYNDKGFLSKETTYKANGIGEFYYTYEYDEDGNLTEKGYYPAKGESTLIKYSDSGTVITDEYTYDENGNLIKHGILNGETWAYYDAEDNLIE